MCAFAPPHLDPLRAGCLLHLAPASAPGWWLIRGDHYCAGGAVITYGKPLGRLVFKANLLSTNRPRWVQSGEGPGLEKLLLAPPPASPLHPEPFALQSQLL